jgi:DNA-binding HxlR family transcriptional regulator
MKINTSNPSACPMEHTMKVIGGKWKLIILWYLAQETQRYSDLQRKVSGITSKMLTQQLRELEQDQVITRKVYAVVPPRVEYSLTKTGQTLLPVIDALNTWGKYSAIPQSSSHQS